MGQKRRAPPAIHFCGDVSSVNLSNSCERNASIQCFDDGYARIPPNISPSGSNRQPTLTPLSTTMKHLGQPYFQPALVSINQYVLTSMNMYKHLLTNINSILTNINHLSTIYQPLLPSIHHYQRQRLASTQQLPGRHALPVAAQGIRRRHH